MEIYMLARRYKDEVYWTLEFDGMDAVGCLMLIS